MFVNSCDCFSILTKQRYYASEHLFKGLFVNFLDCRNPRPLASSANDIIIIVQNHLDIGRHRQRGTNILFSFPSPMPRSCWFVKRHLNLELTEPNQYQIVNTFFHFPAKNKEEIVYNQISTSSPNTVSFDSRFVS
jgi:hypothetical protein